VEPEIVCLAKALASGMPLGAIVAKADIMDWPPGAHASTFGGNPLCCVASLETIRLLHEGLTEHAGTVGEYFLARLHALQAKHELIGDVRGKGLMIGVEIVKDRTTKERGVAERNEVVQACFRRGLLLLGCGENTLRLCPPLVVTEAQVDVAVEILDEALTEVAASTV
jgi:4-aminobutyrate aminotransferase